MKSGKAPHPLEITIKMLKISSKVGYNLVTHIMYQVVQGDLPNDWRSSLIVNYYKNTAR